MIDYSQEFSQKAKELFPSWIQLHDAIANNEEDSVRIELGNIKTLIEPESIVNAFKEGKLPKLYKDAARMVAIRELEEMWYEQYDKSNEEINNKNILIG
jgi:hypothetical protein